MTFTIKNEVFALDKRENTIESIGKKLLQKGRVMFNEVSTLYEDDPSPTHEPPNQSSGLVL